MGEVAVAPREQSSFVGRVHELGELRALLGQERIVTLVGPGGCGKTRLASQLATQSLRLPGEVEAVHWIALEQAQPTDAVGACIAIALDLLVPADADPVETVRAHVRDRSILLVLDNCEHLLDSAREVAERLSGTCPRLVVVATSRVPLKMPGERVYEVPGLAPDDAVTLLLHRAPVRILLDHDTARDISDRLEGMPLALELAAGWLGTLSPKQVADQLHEPFDLLGDRATRDRTRQRSLETSIRWSYDLLNPDEQRLLRRLSVFEPGFTAAAVALLDSELGGVSSEIGLLARLRHLVDASLVAADTSGDEARYHLLGVVRAFASDRLTAAGEHDTAHDAHLWAALTAMDRLRPTLEHDKDTWRAEARRAYPNLRAAMAWGLGRPDPTAGRRLVAALAWLWHLEPSGREGVGLLHRALELGADEISALQAELLVAMALVAETTRGDGAGLPFAEQADVMTRALVGQGSTDTPTSVHASSRLARYLVASGRVDTDLEGCEELARATRLEALEAEDGFVADACQIVLGVVAMRRNDFASARKQFSAPIDALVARGDRGLASSVLVGLALVHSRDLELAPAVECAQRAVVIAEPLRDFHRMGTALCTLSTMLVLQGRLTEAGESLGRIERAIEGIEPPPFIPRYELSQAYLAIDEGRFDDAIAWCRRQGRWNDDPSDESLDFHVQHLLAVSLLHAGRRDEAQRLVSLLMAAPQEKLRPIYWAEVLDLAGLLLHDRDLEAALDLHHEALQIARDSSLDFATLYFLDSLAACHLRRGDLERAATLVAAVDRARQARGFYSVANAPDPRPELEQLMEPEAWAAAVAKGRTMSVDEAATWVTRSRGPRQRPDSGWASLTPTERDVVALAIEGLTNPQIAERLFVSRATVKTHLAHVYAKLGVGGRTELATRAASLADQRA